MSLVDMKGQVALITGSSRGIGKAIAEAMAGQGAKVVIASRKQDACDAVAAELNAKHGAGTAVAVAANISSKENLQHLVDETVAAFGSVTALVKSEEHTSALQSLMRISYAVILSQKNNKKHQKC